MNAPAENNPAQTAKVRLTEACRTKDTSVRLAWAITVCEAILLGGFALALVDYWLMLPVWMRTLGAAGLASLGALGVLRLLKFYRRPTRLKEAALDVETQKPELGCEISTAAEYLAGERKITKEYEPELVAALQTKAEKELGDAQVPYERKLLRPAILLVATLLCLLLFVAVAPVAFTALQRTALPFSKTQYTTVEVIPGNAEIPVGQDVAITNIFSGRPPKDAQFHWQQEGDPQWRSAALARSADGSYVHAIKGLRSDLTYRVTGNDAASQKYRVQTYIPPEVKDLNIRVSYPDYTKLRAMDQKSPDLSAVRASTAQFRILPSVELANAKLRFSGRPELSLETGDDGSWLGSLTITNDTDYWIELADTKGHRGVNDKPYRIKALPDHPPKVEITEPAKDIRASATNRIPIKISVADDFGVGAIRLVFNKLGGTQETLPAQRVGEQNGEVTASAELELSSLGLRDYELVAYHAEAVDTNTLDGPGLGKSPVYFIEITNEEAGPCLSQGQSQKVNLLVIQKQIIADTTALAANAVKDKFEELGARQRDAAEFARMYLDAISGGGAPEPAVGEMQAALNDMESARVSLENEKRAEALPSEEGALAHLYQVLKLMPELENLPTVPQPPNPQRPQSPKVNVVLEAIKQKKQEQPNQQEIEEALQVAKDLARAQSGLNSAFRNQQESEGNGKDAGKGKSPTQGSGEGQGQGQGQDEGNQGEKHSNPPTEPADNAKPQTPAELAGKETELSKEAAALAEKLQRLAGKNTRLGHNTGQGASRAAAKMAAAGQAAAQGGFGAAGEHGFQGELALRSVIAQLERVLRNQPEPTDIANEDFPKEYEALISEYLKKLSYAE